MEEIQKLVTKLANECEAQGIPLIVAYGIDHISGEEFIPEFAPDILKNARAVLFNSTKRARRQIEILA
jgi:hypothetical protein